MKSQDILLLLKLVSLEQQGTVHKKAGLLAIHQLMDLSWKDWDEDSTLDFESTQDPTPSGDSSPYSVRGLAQLTGIGKSEISNALSRCFFSGLAKQGRGDSSLTVNTKALLEFLVYGIRYVFPVKLQENTRGIATCLTAPIFGGELRSTEQSPVWPYAKGNSSGPAIEPLYKTVPVAVNQDPQLYAMLASLDSIRLGLPRERNLAVKKLETLLRG
ncbi:hypothetical protein ABHF33_12445 [Chitinibacter sp. FCG-7]|uniref:Uncharacterized protein n=1 Tax=Chitinibacter mangrovi TaxID=3153927 RepID=A0AAU7F8I4_9NEIS